MKIIIAGGTGNIGVGLARYFLQRGDTLIVPSRSREKIESLQKYVGDAQQNGNLEASVVEMENLAAAERFFAEKFQTHNGFDLAITSLGGWWQGAPLTQVALADWERVMQNNLTAHFVAARGILPLMMRAQRGVYVAINGPGTMLKLKNASLMTIMGAAQAEMSRLFAREARASNVRFYNLFISNVITRERPQLQPGQPGWTTPEEIARYIAENLVEGQVEDSAKVFQKFMPDEGPGFTLPDE